MVTSATVADSGSILSGSNILVGLQLKLLVNRALSYAKPLHPSSSLLQSSVAGHHPGSPTTMIWQCGPRQGECLVSSQRAQTLQILLIKNQYKYGRCVLLCACIGMKIITIPNPRCVYVLSYTVCIHILIHLQIRTDIYIYACVCMYSHIYMSFFA